MDHTKRTKHRPIEYPNTYVSLLRVQSRYIFIHNESKISHNDVANTKTIVILSEQGGKERVSDCIYTNGVREYGGRDRLRN